MSEKTDRWVRISCDYFSDDLFADEVFTEREAYQWLIIKAAWKETTHRVGLTSYPVPRGCQYRTNRELCKAWGWGNTKVRNFLNLLVLKHKIELQNNTNKTFISLCNYNRYQDIRQLNNTETTQEQHTDNTGATHEQHTKGTNNTTSTNTILYAPEEKIEFEDLKNQSNGDLIQSWLLEASNLPQQWEGIWVVSTNEFYNWLNKGCNEQDIRIGLRDAVSKMKALQGNNSHEKMKSWSWASRFIFEAKAKREAPPPDVSANVSSFTGYQPQESAVDKVLREAKESRDAAAQSTG